MTIKQIGQMVEAIGLPCAYYEFKTGDVGKPDGPPFVCWFFSGNDDLAADNINYAKVAQLVIELYTNNVEFQLEAAVEDELTAAELPYGKDQTYIEGERMFQTTYTTEVLIT